MYPVTRYLRNDESHLKIHIWIYYCNVIVDRTIVVAVKIPPRISVQTGWQYHNRRNSN